LLAQMQHDLKTCYGCTQPDHAVLMGLQRTSRQMVGPYLKRLALA
jgi:DNA polymerase-3 subunit epsilon